MFERRRKRNAHGVAKPDHAARAYEASSLLRRSALFFRVEASPREKCSEQAYTDQTQDASKPTANIAAIA